MIIYFVCIIYMTTKCYIVDYDNRINKFKQLLAENEKQLELDNKLNIYNNIISNTNEENNDKYNQLLRRSNSIKSSQKSIQYLNNIEKHLDDILSIPGLSDEDIYNIKKDQEEIYKTLDNINNDIDSINKKSDSCNSETINKTPTITININNRENMLNKNKINPHRIKIN